MTTIKKFLKSLSIGQKLTLIVAILSGCCVVIAATIGLGVPLVGYYLDELTRKNALSTPTYLPPTNAVELPGYQADVLRVEVNPGFLSNFIYGNGIVGVVSQNVFVDPEKPYQPINQDLLVPPETLTTVTEVNAKVPATTWVMITGRSNTESVQLSNRVAVRLISYKKVAEMNLVIFRMGGGADTWLVGADLSKDVLNYPDSLTWATYTPDLFSRLTEIQECCSEVLVNYPSEILNVISSKDEKFPDYFILENNEKLVLSVATFFKEPGVYQLQFGVEYFYGGYKTIGWIEPVTTVYVLDKYYLWDCDSYWLDNDPNGCSLAQSCQYTSNSQYSCTIK